MTIWPDRPLTEREHLESEGMARGIIDTALDAFIQMDESGRRNCLSRFRDTLLYVQSQRGYSVASVSGPR